MDHVNDNFFQVSVKGLHFDDTGKLLMLQEPNGVWELPGGRVQKGEELLDGVKRECLEETGLTCEILDHKPLFVYSTEDEQGRGRIVVGYKIHFQNLNFTPSDECVAIGFYTKEEIKALKKVVQLEKLPDFL